MGLALPLIIGPDIGADSSETLDDVGNVDTDTDEVEDQRSTIEEEVGLAGTEELDEEAEETNGDDNVEHAADQRRGLMYDLEMDFKLVEEGLRNWVAGPEQGKVVGEGSEEDAQEEAYR